MCTGLPLKYVIKFLQTHILLQNLRKPNDDKCPPIQTLKGDTVV